MNVDRARTQAMEVQVECAEAQEKQGSEGKLSGRAIAFASTLMGIDPEEDRQSGKFIMKSHHALSTAGSGSSSRCVFLCNEHCEKFPGHMAR